MNDITITQGNLPANIDDLAKFALIGREKLVAVRAEIRAIEKVGLAQEVREQKLREAQDISEAVLDAEVRIGELMAQVPKAQGKRTDLEHGCNDAPKSKEQIIKEMGFEETQIKRFETLAAHPEIVAQAKAEARENDDIVSRSMVLNKVKEKKEEAKRKEPEPTYPHYSASEYEDRRMHYQLDELMQEMGADDEWEEPKHEPLPIHEQHKPHVTANTGNNEWYTPEQYIDIAREVLGEIDLDPASCDFANRTVRATKFYSVDDDGLSQPWHGRVWLNPPYSADLVSKFSEKLVNEYNDGNVTDAIVLVNNATETSWFGTLISAASAVVFPKGRIRYTSPTRDSLTPLQGQAFIYFGEFPNLFMQAFSSVGWGAIVNK